MPTYSQTGRIQQLLANVQPLNTPPLYSRPNCHSECSDATSAKQDVPSAEQELENKQKLQHIAPSERARSLVEVSSPKAILVTLMCQGMSSHQVREVVFLSPHARKVVSLIGDLNRQEVDELIDLLQIMDPSADPNADFGP